MLVSLLPLWSNGTPSTGDSMSKKYGTCFRIVSPGARETEAFIYQVSHSHWLRVVCLMFLFVPAHGSITSLRNQRKPQKQGFRMQKSILIPFSLHKSSFSLNLSPVKFTNDTTIYLIGKPEHRAIYSTVTFIEYLPCASYSHPGAECCQ